MDIYLAVPDTTHEDAVLACKEECEVVDGPAHIHGSGGLQMIGGYDKWLEKIIEDETLQNPGKRVPATQYIAIRKQDGVVVGFIQLRHQLNDFLTKVGGHIGYSVRPHERGKGYASEMLRLCLDEAQKKGLSRVLVTCDDENVASEKVILRAGGKLENTITLEDGKVKKRFWIELH